MNLRQAAQQALEALEMVMSHGQAVQKAKDTLRAALAEPEQEPVNKYCCHACFNKSGQFFLDRMILCPKCGNKRCPKASHHDLPCTNSNEPGQEGSIYTAPTQRKPQTTHWEGCEAVHPECKKPEQEPVGHADFGINNIYIFSELEPRVVPAGRTPLYTAPTPRKPLTRDEAWAIWDRVVTRQTKGGDIAWQIAAEVEKHHRIGERHE